MGKRANQPASARTTNKKTKVDPALASISAVVMQADDLPDRCRAMFVDMLPFSLCVPADKRREAQTWAVDAVEKILQAQRSALEAAALAEDAKLADLKASGAELANKFQEAEASLGAQNEAVQSAKTVLAEKTESAGAAQNAFLEAQAAQKACGAKLSCVQEEKAALESAFEAHFQVPMRDGSGPHFFELTPFIKQIEMEASLFQALPSCCGKAKNERGSFDEVVLQELEKSVSAKVTALGDAVTAETVACGEHEAAVQAAEADNNEKQDARKQAAEAFEAAEKEQADRGDALAQARRLVDELQVQVDATAGTAAKAKKALEAFETGPLTSFTTYNKQAGLVEAAALGA